MRHSTRFSISGSRSALLRSLLIVALLFSSTLGHALAPPSPSPSAGYRAGDQGEHPNSPRILPEKLLRGYDPITAYFESDVGPGHGPADEGGRLLKLTPAWPGAWTWLDRRTLQFRPAEAWPPLTRFAVEARHLKATLSTMMAAPADTVPASGSENLAPFRAFQIDFAQPLGEGALKKMLQLSLHDLPGAGEGAGRPVRGFRITALPRANRQGNAGYAVTLDDEVPEGKQLRIDVRLGLGDEGRVLWSGRLSARLPFHLRELACGSANMNLVGGSKMPREMALACGSQGETPQLLFSAPVKDLTLTQLKRLVRLDPSVPDMNFAASGTRVTLTGHFLPDVLYRMSFAGAPLVDDSGRPLRDPGNAESFFYLGWKSPFLRWSQFNVLMEARGPRMVPLVGYGDARADVRIYRIDPLSYDLWPFPHEPVLVNEQRAPKFPGEEPSNKNEASSSVAAVEEHIRLLGSPLVSRVVDLPLAKKSGTTRFGLDVGPLLDGVVGKNRPGTYLVGLRRLAGEPERSYVRVQITNLSLTVSEETQRAVFFVRTLDRAEPVAGAKIVLEVMRKRAMPDQPEKTVEVADRFTLTTDGRGQAEMGVPSDWTDVRRVSVSHGQGDAQDTLVLDPRDPPPRFLDNHWAVGGRWLSWLCRAPQPPVNDHPLAFVITERPIYRPGEPVFVKGWARKKVHGELRAPGSAGNYGLKIEGPDGSVTSLPVTFTALGGFGGTFKDTNGASGDYTATFFQKNPLSVLATRSFKIEAYRIPTFEVQLASAGRVRLDAPFKVKALARYYAGGHVSGQPISWSVRRLPYRYVPAGRPGFLFADSQQFARPSAVRTPDSISRSATLDGDGGDQLEVNPALDIDGSARLYRFSATVTGPDQQQASAQTDVLALPPFVLGMKLPRFLEKATEVKPEIIAVGVDDKLSAESVTVRLYRRQWHNQLRETPFATGQAKYVTEQQDTKISETTIRTESKPMSIALPLGASGVYVVELVARDKLGRVQVLSADLYAGGKEAVAWPKPREGVVSLSPDKKSYKPGETAHLVLQSPYQTAHVLTVLEEPGQNRYEWREVSGGKATIDVKVDPRHVPNLPVHVILMRGRIGTGEADDTRYRPQSVAASLDLDVEPVRNQIVVDIHHPDTVRPGQKVNFEVSLADEAKHPLAGEVTFWLVDESVLSLAHEGTLNALSNMIEANRRTLSLSDTRNLVIGRILEQDEQPGGDGGDGEEGAGKPVVRKTFKTVPYYEATVVVGPSGKVTLPVSLSDDLTNFKVRALAVSGFSRFGFKQTTLHQRLPLIVQPQLPRFLRQGDTFWAGGVVRLLEGAEGPATVALKLEGDATVTGGANRKPSPLKMGTPSSVLFPVTVAGAVKGGTGVIGSAGTQGTPTPTLGVRVTVTRDQDGQGDAFEVKLPILPDRIRERVAYQERWKAGPVVLHPLPEAARPGTLIQDLTLSSEPAILEVAAGLEYLVSYPHGCLEQKLSQLASSWELGTFLKQLGLGNDAALRASSKRVLDELPLYQDAQGFFGYWPGSSGDVALTAQAIEFLATTEALGLKADEKVKRRALDALKSSWRSDFGGFLPGFVWNQETSAIRSATTMGLLDEASLLTIFHHRKEMDLSSEADLAVAMGTKPALFATNLAALRGDLWEGLVTKLRGGTPFIVGLRDRRATPWDGRFLGSETSALAAVFESLVRLAPDDPRLPQVRDALLARATADDGFGSTHDNRRALAALALYLARPSTDGRHAKLTLGGQDLLVGQGSANGSGSGNGNGASNKLAHRTERGADPLPLKGGVLTGDEIGARVAYTYLPAAPGTDVASLRQGLIVQRNATLLPAAGGASSRLEDRHGSTWTLKVGDVLELHTQVTTSEDRAQVALVVPFAAGLELLNEGLANVAEGPGAIAKPSESDTLTPTFVERRDEEVRYYFERFPRGTHAFHFRVRATSQGRFVHPAPWAEQMYRADVRGRGEGLKIVVTGGQEK